MNGVAPHERPRSVSMLITGRGALEVMVKNEDFAVAVSRPSLASTWICASLAAPPGMTVVSITSSFCRTSSEISRTTRHDHGNA